MVQMLKHTFIFICTFFLVGCNQSAKSPYQFLLRHNISPPSQHSFTHCRGYGCAIKDKISLTDPEWTLITAPLKNRRSDARQERKALAHVIQNFENIIGTKNGTNNDLGGTFNFSSKSNQHDCVDETINTTTYLTLLFQKRLLYWHNVSQPQTRVPWAGSGLWPHQSALIVEKSSQTRYVVDSWFHDNGQPPEIIQLDLWKTGWKPSSLK